MSMSKKDFIALADVIRRFKEYGGHPWGLSESESKVREMVIDCMIDDLVDFCRSQNSNFMPGRWRDYIAGACGPNGGSVKGKAA